MRFNFLKLLDRILLYLFRRRYVITSFLMRSRLRQLVLRMVRVKNYETMSIFVEVMQKNCGLFFSRHGVVDGDRRVNHYTTPS